MGAPRRTDPRPTDAEGRGWRPARGDLALALLAACAGLGLLVFGVSAPGAAPAGPAAVVAVAVPAATGPALRPVASGAAPSVEVVPTPVMFLAATPAVAAVPAIPRLREPDSDPTPDLADYVNPGEVPTMAEVIGRLRSAGVHGGLAAFSPPGTRPPLVGLAVPEDFDLPPGYVRHHQTTDDGQDIEPILMYSPDTTWTDAAGRPVAIPADRVVPPEHAPPGLPLRRIVVPAPLPAGPGR
jgi:hypothetical protein